MWHVRSLFPNQQLNPWPLKWKLSFSSLDRQESPSTSFIKSVNHTFSFLWVWYDAKWFCGWTYEETDIPSCISHVPSGAGFLHIPGAHPLEISLGDSSEISLEDSVGVKLSFHLFESVFKKKYFVSKITLLRIQFNVYRFPPLYFSTLSHSNIFWFPVAVENCATGLAVFLHRWSMFSL